MAGARVRMCKVRKEGSGSLRTIHGLIDLLQGVECFLQAIVIRRSVIRLDGLEGRQDASDEAAGVSDHVYMYQDKPSLAAGSVKSVLERTDQRDVVVFQAFGWIQKPVVGQCV